MHVLYNSVTINSFLVYLNNDVLLLEILLLIFSFTCIYIMCILVNMTEIYGLL